MFLEFQNFRFQLKKTMMALKDLEFKVVNINKERNKFL